MSTASRFGQMVGLYAQQITLNFVILKLIGLIDWSWWVVLSPTLGVVTLCGFIIGFIYIMDKE